MENFWNSPNVMIMLANSMLNVEHKTAPVLSVNSYEVPYINKRILYFRRIHRKFIYTIFTQASLSYASLITSSWLISLDCNLIVECVLIYFSLWITKMDFKLFFALQHQIKMDGFSHSRLYVASLLSDLHYPKLFHLNVMKEYETAFVFYCLQFHIPYLLRASDLII